MRFVYPPKNSERNQFRRKTLRDLQREYPNSGQVVIGDGTVHMPPELIRESKNYKDLVHKIQTYLKEEELKKFR